jgi:hypothetical protein
VALLDRETKRLAGADKMFLSGEVIKIARSNSISERFHVC